MVNIVMRQNRRTNQTIIMPVEMTDWMMMGHVKMTGMMMTMEIGNMRTMKVSDMAAMKMTGIMAMKRGGPMKVSAEWMAMTWSEQK